MTYPSSDVSRTNADASTDSPASFRVDVLDLIDKFNLLRNWISTFMQGVLNAVDAAAARTVLDVPSRAGSGASGSWSINAASATTAADALGNGQTLQSFTGSRAINTTYTNSSGRTIRVNVCLAMNASSSASISIGGGGVSEDSYYNNTSTTNQYMFHATVPAGVAYNLSASAGCSIVSWSELRV